jgi:hypothetical protein
MPYDVAAFTPVGVDLDSPVGEEGRVNAAAQQKNAKWGGALAAGSGITANMVQGTRGP